jgi:hypothetical protein
MAVGDGKRKREREREREREKDATFLYSQLCRRHLLPLASGCLPLGILSLLLLLFLYTKTNPALENLSLAMISETMSRGNTIDHMFNISAVVRGFSPAKEAKRGKKRYPEMPWVFADRRRAKENRKDIMNQTQRGEQRLDGLDRE